MHKHATTALAVLAALALAACGGGGGEAPPAGGKAATPAPAAAPAVDPMSITDAGSISGSITFAGDAPQAQPLQMAADPFCVSAHSGPVMAQRVVVNDNGTVRYVFVYVKQGLEGQNFTMPSDTLQLAQEGCMYNPHMLGMRVGQTLEVINHDDTLHNVNAQPSSNQGFNYAQPFKDMSTDQVFTTPEIMIPVKCDVHPWMLAYVGVLPHPYFAVTGEDGSFSIEHLPPGDYVIAAWHESMGEQTQNVTVAPNGTAEVSFSFGG